MRPGDIARQRDRFPTASMHGSRWPLAVAQMWVGLLRDGPGDPDTTREVVEALQHALDQLGERATDVELLTASMPGRLALDARRVTIAELAASLSPPPQVAREGDRVEVDVDPALSTRSGATSGARPAPAPASPGRCISRSRPCTRGANDGVPAGLW